MKQNEVDEAIEAMIDSYGAMKFLHAVARVCGEKAAYVAEGGSHGDPSPTLARQWNKVGKLADKAGDTAAEL